MRMQMISNETHSDTIAIRQKKIQFEKWKLINFVKCKLLQPFAFRLNMVNSILLVSESFKFARQLTYLPPAQFCSIASN